MPNVSRSNIRYSQDFSLLNEAREKLEDMIDYFHIEFHPWEKPRTYRRTMRKEYLALAKSKNRTEKKVWSVIRKQLGCIRRNFGDLEKCMEEGYALAPKYIDCYLTILKLYEQQKYMYENHTHSVENRIVSIDKKGHARLEKIPFSPYNESTIFIDAMNR